MGGNLGGEVEDCCLEIAARAGPLDERTGVCMAAVGIRRANVSMKAV